MIPLRPLTSGKIFHVISFHHRLEAFTKGSEKKEVGRQVVTAPGYANEKEKLAAKSPREVDDVAFRKSIPSGGLAKIDHL